MSSEFTEYLISDEDYNLEEFCINYKTKLPTFVCVTQGYCSENEEETLDRGQVIRIDRICPEKRVFGEVIKGSKVGKYVSIPANCDIPFNVLRNSRTEAKCKLAEIVGIVNMPYFMRGTKNASDVVGEWSPDETSVIKCYRVYDHTFLYATFMTKDRLYLSMLKLPVLQDNVRVAQITGVRGFSQCAWNNFQHNCSTYVKKYADLSKISTARDILLYDMDITSDQSERKHLKTSEYYSLSTVNREIENEYDKLPPKLRRRPLTFPIQIPLFANTITQLSSSDLTVPVNRYIPKPDTDVISKSPKERGVCTKNLPPRGRDVKTNQVSIVNNEVETRPELPPRFRKNDFNPKKATGEKQNPKLKGNFHGQKHSCKFDMNDIENYAISDVSHILTLLKLDHYGQVFKEAGIDGKTLSMLTKESLREDFNMRHYEAVKLRNFIKKGHIPK